MLPKVFLDGNEIKATESNDSGNQADWPSTGIYYDYYELTIGVLLVRLFVSASSEVRLTTETFIDNIHSYLDSEKNPLATQVVTTTTVATSKLYNCGFFGDNEITNTTLHNCAVANSVISNLSLSSDDTGRAVYEDIWFDTSDVYDSLLGPHGSLVATTVNNTAIAAGTSLTDQNVDEDLGRWYQLYKATLTNTILQSFNPGVICTESTLIDCEFVCTNGYFKDQTLKDITLSGNTLYLHKKFSFASIKLPEVDLCIYQTSGTNWMLYIRFDNTWIQTSADADDFETNLRTCLVTGGVENIDSCTQYVKDCVESRIKLMKVLMDAEVALAMEGLVEQNSLTE